MLTDPNFKLFQDVALLLSCGDEKSGSLQLVFAANEAVIEALGQK
jgi:hypothetical protein